MNSLAFHTVKASHPNPIVEFRWPVGKEIPADIRRLTIPEFHLAVQLAAKCIRDVRGTLRGREDSLDYSRLRVLEAKEEDFVYKDKYENLLYQFQSYLIETMHAEPSQKYINFVRGELQVQLQEVMSELENLKQMVQPSMECSTPDQGEAPSALPSSALPSSAPPLSAPPLSAPPLSAPPPSLPQKKRRGRKPKVQFAE